ncbi:hypothetical protein FFT13_02880 [Wolbachia endosymbiont of Drosophila santomea]|nr:hypothetical protein FFT13_02880 [Wolbachia endosymbiont of Drosophila santomea]
MVPILQSGQTVILDNATFHKSKKTSEFAKGIGAEILYLPPYSPDFNETEHHWFAINPSQKLCSNLFVKLSILLFYEMFSLLGKKL